MSFAGHLPTKHFSLAEWRAMPVLEADYWPDDGYYRAKVNGKPIVGYCAPLDSGEVSYAARPIVRVPMGRREVA